MYGECGDENVCTNTLHYRCKHCNEVLCLFHRNMHLFKHWLLGRCYFWRNEIP